MGHYLYDDVQKIADAIRYGGQERGYHHHRQARLDEARPQIATDQNSDHFDDLKWSEFYRAMDLAG